SFFKSEYCDFWGVFHDSRLICAGPVFRSKAHVVCWLTLAKTEYLPKKPYEFFYYNLISYYKGQGYSWFDFNPSGGLKGLEHFKKGFATTEFPCPVLDTRPAYMVVLQNIKSSLSS
ncbi:MAG: GNAT family N-acetyltransferase, partial [Balneolales bacterium]